LLLDKGLVAMRIRSPDSQFFALATGRGKHQGPKHRISVEGVELCVYPPEAECYE